MSNTTTNLIEEVSGLLNNGVADVFNTMFTLQAHPLPVEQLQLSGQPLVVGSVGFSGIANGVVHIHVTASFARHLASRMLGMTEAEIEGDEMVNDVIGELSNMVVGAVKSNLCDTDNTCVLSIPSIVRGQDLHVSSMSSAERAVLGFRCGENHILVELQTKTAA